MKKLIILLPFLFLNGCTTLSKSECKSGDWYGIGQEDGAQGATLNRLGLHRDACDKFSIQVDGTAWRKGRTVGLKQFCRPINGYYLGRSGGSYNNVCPDLTFNQAYNYGIQINQHLAQLNDLEIALAEQEKAVLNDKLSKQKRREHLNKSKIIEAEIREIRYIIQEMEEKNPYSS